MFMGPPGSGKGTHARELEQKFGFKRFQSGGVLRAMRYENTPVAKLVTKLIDAGRLAPPPIIASIAIEKTKEILETGNTAVYDGSPRTLYEAEIIMRELKDYADKIFVISMDVPMQETITRLAVRLICSECNTPAPTGFSGETCPVCGGKMVRRADDDPKITLDRWEEYEFRTKPVIHYLETLGIVEHVNTDQPIEDTAKDVEKVVKNRLKI